MQSEDKNQTATGFAEEFAVRLRELRNKNNISAREMSISLGQNVNYINLIENGKRMPSMQGFFSICEYLKTSPSAFFFCEQKQDYEEKIQISDLFLSLTQGQKQSLISLIREFKK